MSSFKKTKFTIKFSILQFEIKAASGEGMAATSVMLWDGPEGEIMPYDHVPEADWSATACYCCFENPIPTVSIKPFKHYLKCVRLKGFPL